MCPVVAAVEPRRSISSSPILFQATEVLHVKKLGPIKIFAVYLDTWRPYGDMKFINL